MLLERAVEGEHKKWKGIPLIQNPLAREALGMFAKAATTNSKEMWL